jgi:itaconate CoA-transferase
MYMFSGILAALFARATSGDGAHVEVSLFDALAEWMGAPAYHTMYGGRAPQRCGVEHATIAPYGAYTTADGDAIVIAVQTPREWASLCRMLLDDAALESDRRYATNAARVANREALNQLIAGRVARLSTAGVTALLDAAGIASARINTVAEFLDHPALTGRNRWTEVGTPQGAIRALLPPLAFSGTAPRMDPVPGLGEHTDSILRELGFTMSEIEALQTGGAVSSAAAERRARA